MLADYLSGKVENLSHSVPPIIIYPFGTNKSQKKAVANLNSALITMRSE